MVDAGVCVDVVVDVVGIALVVPLGRGGGGGGGLDGGHWLPHSHICPVSKGLDCVTCGWKMMETLAVETFFREGKKSRTEGIYFLNFFNLITKIINLKDSQEKT